MRRRILEYFEGSRKGKSGGNSTNAEQDLLRAMLVFAAAGLDAAIKQLVRDALPCLIACGREGSVEALEAFTVRKLQARGLDSAANVRNGLNFTWLAEVMVRQDPRVRLVEHWVDDLTAGSLQSVNAIQSTANAFGIKFQSLFPEGRKRAQTVFEARNDIIHEMDLKLGGSYATARKRHQRSKGEMCEDTQLVFDIAARFLGEVEAVLSAAPGA